MMYLGDKPIGINNEFNSHILYDNLIQDQWHHINVTAIDYTTGIITLENNTAAFTNDWNTTTQIIIVPLLEGIRPQYKLGFMPQELYKNGEKIIYARLVGTNQIELSTDKGTTTISPLTENTNIDLSRWQIWVPKNSQSITQRLWTPDFQNNHRYHIQFFNPYGIHRYADCAPYLREVSDYVNAGYNAYGVGYGAGYGTVDLTLNEKLATVTVREANPYEFLPRYLVEGYATPSYADGASWRYFPCFFEAEIYPASSGTWIFDVEFTWFIINDRDAFNANTVPKVFTVRPKAYLNGMPKCLRTDMGIDGQRLTIWDLGRTFN